MSAYRMRSLDRVLHYGQPLRTEAQVRMLRELHQRAIASRDPEDWAEWRRAHQDMQERR